MVLRTGSGNEVFFHSISPIHWPSNSLYVQQHSTIVYSFYTHHLVTSRLTASCLLLRLYLTTSSATMSNDSDFSRITDLTVLRTKRGARKRNIGRVETYLRSVRELPPQLLKVAELTRQLDFPQTQSNLYQEIQERLIQLL